jgi:hypothetical protein
MYRNGHTHWKKTSIHQHIGKLPNLSRASFLRQKQEKKNHHYHKNINIQVLLTTKNYRKQKEVQDSTCIFVIWVAITPLYEPTAFTSDQKVDSSL